MRVPRDDADPLEWLLFAQAGVLTWAQAVTAVGPGRARHLLASGRWRRICRGVVVARPGELTRDQVSWVAVLAAGPGAVLAGVAAARAGGLRGRWRNEAVDVLVPYERRSADLLRRLPLGLPAVRVRRSRRLPAEHLQRGRPDRTTMARSLVDAAGWARSDDEAQAVVAAGCQQRLVMPSEVRGVLAELPNAPRRRLIMETIGDAEGGATALSEIDLVRLCRRFGLPQPDLQERRIDASGRVRYLDAYWRAWRLHVEVDGAHHMDISHWAADMRRQNDVWIAGDRILRFPAWVLRRRPEEVAAQISAALRAGGWPGRL